MHWRKSFLLPTADSEASFTPCCTSFALISAQRLKSSPCSFLLPQPIFLQIFSVLAKSLFYPIFFSKNKVNDLLYYSKALQNLIALHAKPVAKGLNLPHNMWVRNHVYENEKFLLLLKTLLLCLLEKCIHVISNKGSVALLEMPTVACNTIRKSSLLHKKVHFALYRSEIQWLTRFPPLLHGIGRIIGQNCLTF